MSLKKIYYKILILINSSWVLSIPKKNKYIIFDKNGSDLIKNVFKKNFFLLDTRYEEFYFFILFKTLLSFNYKNIYFRYLINVIKYIDPKYVLTHNDNSIVFYKLKKIFPSIKFIAIQNGNRFSEGDFMSTKKQLINLKKQKIKSDIYLVHNELSKVLLSKIINSRYIVTGSLKNNIVKLKKLKKNKKIIFISQWRDAKTITLGEKIYPYSMFNAAEIFFFKKLFYFCKKNLIFMDIKLTSTNPKEVQFYNSIIKRDNKLIKFIKFSNNINKNYSNLDRYTLVATVDSTLGFECLSRNLKVIFFSGRHIFLKQKIQQIPCKLSNLIKIKNTSASFYLESILEKKKFYDFINFNYFSSYSKWYRNNHNYIKKLAYFNEGNKKIREDIFIK